VDDALTARRRAVLVAIALNEVPPDTLVPELAFSSNAIYQTLFDVRHKVRASLVAKGYRDDDCARSS